MIVDVAGTPHPIQPSGIVLIKKETDLLTKIFYAENTSGDYGVINLAHDPDVDSLLQEELFQAVRLALREPWREVKLSSSFNSISYDGVIDIGSPEQWPAIVGGTFAYVPNGPNGRIDYLITYGLFGEADGVTTQVSYFEDFRSIIFQDFMALSGETSISTKDFPDPRPGISTCLYIRVIFHQGVYTSVAPTQSIECII